MQLSWCFSRSRSLACDVSPMVNASLNTTTAAIVTSHLGQRAKVFFAVCGRNGAGAKACFFSTGVLVDMTAPPPFTVIDSPILPDAQYQSFIDSIVGAALNASDPDSPIAEVSAGKFFILCSVVCMWVLCGSVNKIDTPLMISPLQMYWCVESSAATPCNVIALKSIGGNCTTWYESNLALQAGTRYYVRMVAANAAGLQTVAVSDGVIVGRNKVVLADVIKANGTTGVTMMFDSLTLAQEDTARRTLSNSTDSASSPTPVPPVFGSIDLPDSEVRRAGGLVLQAAAASSSSYSSNSSDLPEKFATPQNKSTPHVSLLIFRLERIYIYLYIYINILTAFKKRLANSLRRVLCSAIIRSS